MINFLIVANLWCADLRSVEKAHCEDAAVSCLLKNYNSRMSPVRLLKLYSRCKPKWRTL